MTTQNVNPVDPKTDEGKVKPDAKDTQAKKESGWDKALEELSENDDADVILSPE